MAESDTEIEPKDTEPSDPFNPEFYRLNQDLKLGRLGLEIAMERSLSELAPDFEDKLAEGKPVVDFQQVLERVPEYTGLTKEQYLEAVAFQDLNLNDFVNRIGQMGQPIRQVLDDYKENEVPAALTPEDRILRYKQKALIPAKKKAIASLGERRIRSGQARVAKEL